MTSISADLVAAVRDRFAHVDACPFDGPRVFFENAGGALHLKKVVETSAFYAGIPDNQGRDNPASAALMAVIARGKADMMTFLNAREGRVFVGESGSEVLFRLIRTAAWGAEPGGVMVSTSLEHPASFSAMVRWAGLTGRPHLVVPHDPGTGTVTPDAYRAVLTPEARVVSVVHTSPVTGMAVDVEGVIAAVREVAPGALVIVDGIQHASHGAVDVTAAGADGYAVSPYKVFSRHGYGVGWASERLTACDKEQILNGPSDNWELGTRDTGAYATFSDVVDYLDWLGGQVSDATDRRARLEAAGRAIAAQEHALAEAMLEGTGNLAGLNRLPGIRIVGHSGTEGREGVISFVQDGRASPELVTFLRGRGIRVHTRKADHYSGNVLRPLGMEDCVRVSFSHYNTIDEVARFLDAMREATGA